MVSFQQIQDAIALNVHRSECMNIRPHPLLPVDQFKIPTVNVKETKIPQRVVEPKQPTNRVMNSQPVSKVCEVPKIDSRVESDSEESLPPPTRCIGTRPVEKKPENVLPSETKHTQSNRPLPSSTRCVDPICIAIELQDTMYAIASPNVRTSLECSEAQRLESIADKLYKEESGRQRGWTKTKLTEFLVPRAAAGGRPKLAFDWSTIWTQKEASALLDFVCLAKGIRLAVWKSDQEVGLWPAADKEGTTPPLFHVSSTGAPLQDRSISNINLIAPYSVVAGLEKLSVGELESVAEKMNVSLPRGKKGELAAFLASARMRMRLA